MKARTKCNASRALKCCKDYVDLEAVRRLNPASNTTQMHHHAGPVEADLPWIVYAPPNRGRIGLIQVKLLPRVRGLSAGSDGGRQADRDPPSSALASTDRTADQASTAGFQHGDTSLTAEPPQTKGARGLRRLR